MCIFITGCSINTGITNLEKATSELMGIEGELIKLEADIDRHEETPINFKVFGKKLDKIGSKLESLSTYTVDETFEERLSRVNNSYDEIFKKINNLQEKVEL